MLRTVLAEERERDREHLAASLAGVQGDVTVMQSKVQAVEAIVAQQVQDTVRALDRVTKAMMCRLARWRSQGSAAKP